MADEVLRFSHNANDSSASNGIEATEKSSVHSPASTSTPSSVIAHTGQASTDHEVIERSGDDAKPTHMNYGKRMFPGWKPIEYGEWHIYPDKRERRHDVSWRGEQTAEEVTLENSRKLGQKKPVVDSRGGVPELSPGDKPYQVPEYMPEFHKIGSTRPVVNFGQHQKPKPDTFIPLHESSSSQTSPTTAYNTKRAQQLRDEEIAEVRKLSKWRPFSPLKP